jgi:hypothetical protein
VIPISVIVPISVIASVPAVAPVTVAVSIPVRAPILAAHPALISVPVALHPLIEAAALCRGVMATVEPIDGVTLPIPEILEVGISAVATPVHVSVAPRAVAVALPVTPLR